MKRFTLVFALACAFLSASRGADPICFLKIPSIPGDSVVEKHAGEIDVVDFQHTIDRPDYFRATSVSFSVTKQMDRASPALAKAAATGANLGLVRLTLRRSGSDPTDLYTVLVDGATIVSFDQISKNGLVMESVTFSGTKITWTYSPQKSDGTLDKPIVETAPIGRRHRD